MKKTIIIYGTLGGNTRVVANKINTELGGEAKVIDVKTATAEDLSSNDNLILGTSTTGYGELLDSWIDFIHTLKKADLKDKTIALFGLGDSSSFSDTFTNGMAAIYEAIKDKGANIIGSVSEEGYTYDDSASVIKGRFVGLALDEDNEDNKTPERVKSWISEIRPKL